MNRDELGTALRALGVELQRRGVQGDLYVVGGAAMALAYDTRRSTRDIDAIFEPKLVIYEAAARVADELGLPADWLNDGVKGFLVGADPYEAPVLEFPGVRVQMASPQMLLALKVVAARIGEDDDDVATLAAMLGLASAAEVLDLVTAVAGASRLGPRSQFFVEEIMDHNANGG
ncbi:MAG: nucleotidyltransferase [Actinomycetota bacterium]|jgi:predicted nucleotidyltransferase|nr:hypothetical protein [Euzebyaceae bacterium]MDQ3452559.1 nucleotidyltransferase [Actinomycetota bacterium]